ncbi:39S ribosomal protein L22, mitochondrial [Drosophila grimshawi]|uniref:Large ribosomal subunit protein uL22m n=1 Tax=Drosophila grimshawi TaxID=7222 RepID=B4JP10_DROGR|nr:39S ribosomal protein L22, mitochondrial [Drosophila grimshawi]EDV92453.1 GH24048 [Drosophila grimshawi]
MYKVIRQMTQLKLQAPLLTSAPAASAANLLAFPQQTTTTQNVHTAATGGLCAKWNKNNHGPRKWLEYNKTVHPPQETNEEPRKAYLCHMRSNIKYSPDKMWYIAAFVRGMSVDEALKQLNFVLKKGATDVKETILEAQQMAVERHNVEYKSNLWIAESFVGKGRVFKGMRRHARGRFGRVEYKHCHYFLRLEEGEPPQHYYMPEPQTPQQQYEHWVEQMRSRKVINSL